MGLAILGVIVVLFIVLAYFASRTWQAWHVVLSVFLFLAVFVFSMLTAATLKVQKRWRDTYQTNVAQIETETRTEQEYLRGSADGTLGKRQLVGQAKRMIVDRGRAWRQLRLADLTEGEVILDGTNWSTGCYRLNGAADEDDFESEELEEGGEADAAAPPAANATAMGLEVESVVYAFQELPVRALSPELRSILLGDEPDNLAEKDTRGQCRVPVFYMGEYRVASDPAANPQAITLTPTIPLRQAQLDRLQDGQASWVLYDVMPVDSHEAFAGLSAEQIAQLIPPGSLNQEAYQRLVDSYARDLTQAQPTDPPERKWMTIKFTQPHTETVDVDAQAGQPLPDSFFDPSGRSLVATLNQGGNTEFSPGDEVTFDFATAQRLINDGKAEPVNSIFHRGLRDYSRYFRAYETDLESLARQIVLAESDLGKLNESIENLKSQIAFQEQRSTDLKFDVDGVGRERAVLTEYLAALDAKWDELRLELSRLYRTNRSLVRAMQAGG